MCIRDEPERDTYGGGASHRRAIPKDRTGRAAGRRAACRPWTRSGRWAPTQGGRAARRAVRATSLRGVRVVQSVVFSLLISAMRSSRFSSASSNSTAA